MNNRIAFITIVLALVFTPFIIRAENVLGDSTNFYIESYYDSSKREQVQSTLQKISQKAYWYIDEEWYNSLTEEGKQEIGEGLDALTIEFDTKIYPTLTSNVGSEWNPGIDKDSRITMLIHPMIDEAGGYFNSADEYPKSQIPESNEREMIYFNANHLTDPLAKSFLSHEFQHLISFNQKERKFNVSEDVWLNEARSEYMPTLVGYNQEAGSNVIQQRIRNFLDKPYDSLTEWRNATHDYGVVNIFVHYLVDHYGKGILIDSLKSANTGIDSLNYALARAGFSEDFAQIFADWTIAVLINDCSVSLKYCYLNPNFKNLKLSALINYLPSTGKSVLSVTNTTKDWAGNWHKFIGGNHRALELEFSGPANANFKVPYLIQDNQGNFAVDFLQLNGEQKGIINVPDFGSQNISLTIIPVFQNKISGFSNLEPSVTFFWSASTVEEKSQEEEELMTRLLAQIAELQRQIAALQTRINAILGKPSQKNGQISCQRIKENLYYGMRNDTRVRCLQEFLELQDADIYPEQLVTGNFLSLTKTAVIRFQEKYSGEVLAPLGLENGTGFVGPMTRAKINQLMPQ